MVNIIVLALVLSLSFVRNFLQHHFFLQCLVQCCKALSGITEMEMHFTAYERLYFSN